MLGPPKSQGPGDFFPGIPPSRWVTLQNILSVRLISPHVTFHIYKPQCSHVGLAPLSKLFQPHMFRVSEARGSRRTCTSVYKQDNDNKDLGIPDLGWSSGIEGSLFLLVASYTFCFIVTDIHICQVVTYRFSPCLFWPSSSSVSAELTQF